AGASTPRVTLAPARIRPTSMPPWDRSGRRRRPRAERTRGVVEPDSREGERRRVDHGSSVIADQDNEGLVIPVARDREPRDLGQASHRESAGRLKISAVAAFLVAMEASVADVEEVPRHLALHSKGAGARSTLGH